MDELICLSDEELQILAAGGSADAWDILTQRYTELVESCVYPYYLEGG